MLLEHENLRIRNANVNDAELLAKWWNDGKVMAHAGFPNGLGETVESIASKIEYTDYDILIQLCDGISLPNDVCIMKNSYEDLI